MNQLVKQPQTNRLDRAIGYFSPALAAKRMANRQVMNYYEAAEITKDRNFYRKRGSQNENVQRSAYDLRVQARHAVLNHDIARGVLRTMVNNVVGNGVGVEPQPRRDDGSIHEDYANALREAWRDWSNAPEVTGRFKWGQAQRMMAWSRYRDGEVFAQMIIGNAAYLNHGSRVPLSIELIDAESVPLNLNSEAECIIQGIKVNTWGRPIELQVVKSLPWSQSSSVFYGETKGISWDRVLHYVGLDNIGQMRGVTEFASILNRLEDVKDYEESERIAAKVAAMLTAYIKKGTPDDYKPQDEREIAFTPATIIDTLGPGEDIGMIDSKRPNPNLITFRAGQLKAVASGIGASYSTISKNYDGTFSAQRQELVEQWVNYAVETDNFVCQVLQPIWQQFVRIADLSGVVPMPRNVDANTLDDALFVGQQMPWIDPLKEAAGNKLLVDAGFASEIEIIRKRGQNPYDVLEQIVAYRKKMGDAGLGKSEGMVDLLDTLLQSGD